MKCRAGFLKMFACLVILLPILDAGRVAKKHADGDLCQPKELTALTKRLVEMSLISFDEANGKHLGTWSPGFPELNQNSPISGSKVQCSLIFMAQGLGEILEDQSTNLNPQDVSLHKKLKDTILKIKMLALCLGSILGGKCSSQPSSPTVPVYVFERKQWSHTLLKTARDYLDWLENSFGVRILKVKGKNNIKRKVTQPEHLTYLEGSGYLL